MKQFGFKEVFLFGAGCELLEQDGPDGY